MNRTRAAAAFPSVIGTCATFGERQLIRHLQGLPHEPRFPKAP
jgi:hypothetical protein